MDRPSIGSPQYWRALVDRSKSIERGDTVEIPFDGLDHYERLTVLAVDALAVWFLSSLDVRRTPRCLSHPLWQQKVSHMTAFYPAGPVGEARVKQFLDEFFGAA